MKGETRKEDVKQNEKKVKTISVLIFTFSKLVQTIGSYSFQVSNRIADAREERDVCFVFTARQVFLVAQ